MQHLNLLQRIEAKKSGFSKGQRRLAEYIGTNYDIAAYLTASKLGKAAGVSESTVVRFACQLEYEGYPQLQNAIQVIVKTNSDSAQRMSLSSKRYEEHGVLKSILATDSDRLKDTMTNGVSQEEFDRAVELLNKADRIFLLGSRSSAYLSGLFGYYLRMFLDNVILVDAINTAETLEQIISIGPGDVIVGMTFPRYSKRTYVAFEFARNHGAGTVAITDSMDAPVVSFSDCSLIAKTDVMTVVDSMVGPLSIVNALVTAIALMRKDEVEKRLMALEELWKEYDVYKKR